MDSATKMRSNGGKARAAKHADKIAEWGRNGGTARAANLSAAERRDAAKVAAAARWSKKKKRKAG